MTVLHRQSDTCDGICQYLAAFAALLTCCAALAGEPAVELSDKGEAPATAIPLNEPVAPLDDPVPLAEAVTTADGLAEPMHLLGADVAPGTARRLSWSATELFEGVPVSTPVLVVNGKLPGPTLCLTAAVHGDELNGIEMVRRVMHDIDPQKLSGAMIGVPIVNVHRTIRSALCSPGAQPVNVTEANVS